MAFWRLERWPGMTAPDPAQKFDGTRAAEYEEQSRIALAGYDACHELAACMLAASLGSGGSAHLLIAGAGGGAREIVEAGALEPRWRFTAVDPSQPMLDLAVAKLRQTGLLVRTRVVLGTVADLPPEPEFDAATLIGVLHHLANGLPQHRVSRRFGPSRWSTIPPTSSMQMQDDRRDVAVFEIIIGSSNRSTFPSTSTAASEKNKSQ